MPVSFTLFPHEHGRIGQLATATTDSLHRTNDIHRPTISPFDPATKSRNPNIARPDPLDNTSPDSVERMFDPLLIANRSKRTFSIDDQHPTMFYSGREAVIE